MHPSTFMVVGPGFLNQVPTFDSKPKAVLGFVHASHVVAPHPRTALPQKTLRILVTEA